MARAMDRVMDRVMDQVNRTGVPAHLEQGAEDRRAGGPPLCSRPVAGHGAAAGNAVLESAQEQRRRLEQRLREVQAQIAGSQESTTRLLAEKALLLQRKRRAEALIAFASAPKLMRQDRCCPACYVQHGSRILLDAVPGSTPLGQYRCAACTASYVLEPERPMEASNPPTAAAASVRLYLPNTNKESLTCV